MAKVEIKKLAILKDSVEADTSEAKPTAPILESNKKPPVPSKSAGEKIEVKTTRAPKPKAAEKPKPEPAPEEKPESAEAPAPEEAPIPKEVTETPEATKEEPPTEKPTPDEPAKDEPVKEASKEAAAKTKELEVEAAEQAKRQASAQKLIDEKKYFLPINTVEQRKTKQFVVMGVLLSLLLAAAWVNIALDAGLIQIDGLKPVTHFFSS